MAKLDGMMKFLTPHIEDIIEENDLDMTLSDGIEILTDYLTLLSKCLHDVRIPRIVIPWGHFMLSHRAKLNRDVYMTKPGMTEMGKLVRGTYKDYIDPIIEREEAGGNTGFSWHGEGIFYETLRKFKIYQKSRFFKRQHPKNPEAGIAAFKDYINKSSEEKTNG